MAASLGALAGGAAMRRPIPSRVIKMIVPFPPGGADVIARLVADRLTVALGQPFIVENRPGGAGGTVGAKSVAIADPDGHTLLFSSPGPLTASAAINRNLDYDPIKSFAPVATIAMSPFLLVIHPVGSGRDRSRNSSPTPKPIPARSATHRPAPARCRICSASCSSSAPASRCVHVPYRGSAPAITDLLAGQMQMYFDNSRNVLSFVQAGKLRALAVTSEARVAELPDLPTMPESGHGEFLATYWNGVLAPAGTPAAVVDKLNAAINASLQTAEVQASVARLGMAPKIGSPQDFAGQIAAEFAKWTAVAKAADIRVD